MMGTLEWVCMHSTGSVWYLHNALGQLIAAVRVVEPHGECVAYECGCCGTSSYPSIRLAAIAIHRALGLAVGERR